jgi:hypothetical protein
MHIIVIIQAHATHRFPNTHIANALTRALYIHRYMHAHVREEA